MARGGLYKTEVEKARNALSAQGRHPSVDAVRVELGNTGSKTTIHRYLKELETEDAQGVGVKFPISDALADLVSKLAGRLNEEADKRIADAKAQFEAQLRDRTEALERHMQEVASFSAQLQRTEVALQTETAEHATVRQALASATVAAGQREERIAGLTTRITEHEAHAQSLEEKHQHAREALEHYRTSVKEQRDQEQRRHEHQVQELQVALRQANEVLTTKNHELLQLNRDNARMTEHIAQLDKDLQSVRGEVRELLHEATALRPLPTELHAVQTQVAQHMLDKERLEKDVTAARGAAAQAQDARNEVEARLAQARARLEILDELFAKLEVGQNVPKDARGAASSGKD